jgi:anti-sigma B factor antagonist
LSSLLAAVRVAPVQANLSGLRLLHVLRRLLLIFLTVPAGLQPEPLSHEEENNVALKMTNREVDGVAVVALDGRIVLGEESNALREKVKALIAEGKKKIVLNMDNITFIDSAGLGTLVAAHHSVKSQGASLRLCHLGSKFQEVLQITKLLTVFDVYNSEAEAVASFSK